MGTVDYLPPTGLSFRLHNHNGYTMYSRSSTKTACGVAKDSLESDEQWFQLLYGTGRHVNKVAIRGNVSQKVIFSRTTADPHVGDAPGDGKYYDNWHVLEPGKGDFSGYFRIRNLYTKTFIVATKGQELSNVPDSEEERDDQYWTFLFEDVEVIDVDYHIDAAKILSSVPITLNVKKLKNESAKERELIYSVNKTRDNVSSFLRRSGFPVRPETKLSAGTPAIVKGVPTITLGMPEFTWGSTTTDCKDYAVTLEVPVRPHKSLEAVATVTESLMDVPFTMVSVTKKTNVRVTTEGSWIGVSVWDFRVKMKAWR